jgi:signal transduction histidine kinase
MNYALIKKATILSVIAFCILLVAGAIQFAFTNNINPFLYKLISLTIAYAVVFGIHFWSTAYQNTIGFQKKLLSILYIEIFFTIVILVPLIFNWFDTVKTMVFFLSFQLIHGAIYLCNMFLYDEKPIQKLTLSNHEILKKSQSRPISPANQGFGNDSDC